MHGLLQQHGAVVGLHPDEATDAIVDTALATGHPSPPTVAPTRRPTVLTLPTALQSLIEEAYRDLSAARARLAPVAGFGPRDGDLADRPLLAALWRILAAKFAPPLVLSGHAASLTPF